jgi:hypothetical protein
MIGYAIKIIAYGWLYVCILAGIVTGVQWVWSHIQWIP